MCHCFDKIVVDLSAQVGGAVEASVAAAVANATTIYFLKAHKKREKGSQKYGTSTVQNGTFQQTEHSELGKYGIAQEDFSISEDLENMNSHSTHLI
jgi:hypothetical protein